MSVGTERQSVVVMNFITRFLLSVGCLLLLVGCRDTRPRMITFGERDTLDSVAFARTQQGHHVLALVSVSPQGPAHDQLRYVYDAFAHIDPAVTTLSYNERWNKYWQRGTQPA